MNKYFLNELDSLREIDHVVTTALREEGEYEAVWQAPVVILPLVNDRDEQCIVLRPIMSQEAMTAHFVPLGKRVLERIVEGAARIEGIGDLFFDVTHKPPGTIEWE